MLSGSYTTLFHPLYPLKCMDPIFSTINHLLTKINVKIISNDDLPPAIIPGSRLGLGLSQPRDPAKGALAGIADHLPNPAIIPKPEKVADMIWIMERFQTLLRSALMAVILPGGLVECFAARSKKTAVVNAPRFRIRPKGLFLALSGGCLFLVLVLVLVFVLVLFLLAAFALLGHDFLYNRGLYDNLLFLGRGSNGDDLIQVGQDFHLV